MFQRGRLEIPAAYSGVIIGVLRTDIPRFQVFSGLIAGSPRKEGNRLLLAKNMTAPEFRLVPFDEPLYVGLLFLFFSYFLLGPSLLDSLS